MVPSRRALPSFLVLLWYEIRKMKNMIFIQGGKHHYNMLTEHYKIVSLVVHMQTICVSKLVSFYYDS